jgi:hypothetical protein
VGVERCIADGKRFRRLFENHCTNNKNIAVQQRRLQSKHNFHGFPSFFVRFSNRWKMMFLHGASGTCVCSVPSTAMQIVVLTRRVHERFVGTVRTTRTTAFGIQQVVRVCYARQTLINAVFYTTVLIGKRVSVTTSNGLRVEHYR